MKSLDDLDLKPYAGMPVTVLPWAGDPAIDGTLRGIVGTGWVVDTVDGQSYVLRSSQFGPRA